MSSYYISNNSSHTTPESLRFEVWAIHKLTHHVLKFNFFIKKMEKQELNSKSTRVSMEVTVRSSSLGIIKNGGLN